MANEIDACTLTMFLRQRRIDLGLTLDEIAARMGLDVTGSLILAYEDGELVPSLRELVAWADALGCDVEITVRPAPPMKTRFGSLDELRQDLRDNAWARRVAAPAIPDDLGELRRRLDEERAVVTARTRMEIDPNVRCRGNQTRTGLEDCHGPIAVGDVVTVYEPEARIEGTGRIADIDYDKQLVWLEVDWAGLRDMEEPT